ncbi:MAG TPA: hypothetical protein PLN21_00315 [Gemmatales bacterium]|nr:hypothetical protein [Gemmatales bacterium]
MAVKSSPNIVLDTPPPAEKWESEDEFEARLNRIQSKVDISENKPKSELNICLDSDEVARLKHENAQLRQLGEEARRRITQLEAEAVKVLKRDADVEKMLEEKSEQIREMEKVIDELQAKQSSGVSEEELIALHGELERERETLEEDRQSMEGQFRQLELSMARERAEIARERNELKRTMAELKLKLETIEKSSQNDMSPLRRLRDELRRDPAGLLTPGGTTPTYQSPTGGPAPLPNLPAINRRAPEGEDTPRRSGILSRFLGKKDE